MTRYHRPTTGAGHIPGGLGAPAARGVGSNATAIVVRRSGPPAPCVLTTPGPAGAG